MATIDERRATAQADQQRAVRLPAPLYIQACPGAGKTRVIVERHLSGERSGARRGRAAVSFTNVACDEIHRRCREAGQPHLAAFPNFVGTIDAFLWRYLVRPFLSPDRMWHRIDSWDRIDATVVVNGTHPHTMRLNDFQWSRDPDSSECRAQLLPKRRNRKVFQSLSKQNLLQAAARAAVRRRDDLAKQGHVTGHEIRIRALRQLREDGRKTTALLATRFDEIIVDEAQDCSALDLAILTELREAGVPLVFVCDPDQAIYEFRGALPDSVRHFGKSLGKQITLAGNWRSSNAICGLAATLRASATARPPDDAVGPNHDEAAGILLIQTAGSQPEQALTTFNAHADAMAIAPERRLALAHAAARLPNTTHTTASIPPENSSARVAWAATIVNAVSSSTSLRNTAYEILQRALLRFWYTDDDTGNRTVAAICDTLELDQWRLRRLAAQLASALSKVDEGTFASWCTTANTTMKRLPPHPEMTRRSSSGSLRAGNLASATPRTAGGVPKSQLASVTRASVVHQVKGEEEDAVLVIVPADDRTDALIDAWVSGEHPPELAESLRVLYVAATRARRLLAIALPDDSPNRVAAHLKEREVPFELIIPKP
ncbi:UvrD-helicase domain-containing protein [Lentzea aerocolonigenes]|uniref:UvrD-helicase domain-containing protein n=1 Tax=Lentzea aerocolonigenes TaxID=68170 RepID=UPI0004C321F4|nr:UvrD-helicase domain-containing protein [Lentzea aerocolonigenes]MCP2243279.1 hypothetical protein [Lentzea aerocolonigenes]